MQVIVIPVVSIPAGVSEVFGQSLEDTFKVDVVELPEVPVQVQFIVAASVEGVSPSDTVAIGVAGLKLSEHVPELVLGSVIATSQPAGLVFVSLTVPVAVLLIAVIVVPTTRSVSLPAGTLARPSAVAISPEGTNNPPRSGVSVRPDTIA